MTVVCDVSLPALFATVESGTNLLTKVILALF